MSAYPVDETGPLFAADPATLTDGQLHAALAWLARASGEYTAWGLAGLARRCAERGDALAAEADRRAPRATLFALGQVVATPGALDALDAAGVRPATLLARHARGDWGDVCREDAAENEVSLAQGERLLSVYLVGVARVWVLTEADRSATTLLLPEEY